jgi:hypothetical protein
MNPPPALRTAAAAAASALPMLLALSMAAGPALAAPPSAQLFVAVKKPEAVDPDWRARLCTLLPQPCDAQALGLYKPRGAAAGGYAVISAEPLAIARVQRNGGKGKGAGASGWQLERLHDFSGYAEAIRKDPGDPMSDARLSLAPALYPLAEGQWAVAVVQTVSESYSGGGAAFSKADFVPLEGTRMVAEGIPYSCTKMVRACFSEKEYKQSKHCHDESSGSLRITYGEPARPGEPYRWQYTWLQSDWPAHAPANAATTSRLHFAATTTERVGFCGGPQ